MIADIVLPQTLLNIQAAKEDVSITVNIQDYLPQGVTIYGDTGTVTITATISPIEADTEDATEEETTDEG